MTAPDLSCRVLCRSPAGEGLGCPCSRDNKRPVRAGDACGLGTVHLGLPWLWRRSRQAVLIVLTHRARLPTAAPGRVPRVHGGVAGACSQGTMLAGDRNPALELRKDPDVLVQVTGSRKDRVGLASGTLVQPAHAQGRPSPPLRADGPKQLWGRPLSRAKRKLPFSGPVQKIAGKDCDWPSRVTCPPRGPISAAPRLPSRMPPCCRGAACDRSRD